MQRLRKKKGERDEEREYKWRLKTFVFIRVSQQFDKVAPVFRCNLKRVFSRNSSHIKFRFLGFITICRLHAATSKWDDCQENIVSDVYAGGMYAYEINVGVRVYIHLFNRMRSKLIAWMIIFAGMIHQMIHSYTQSFRYNFTQNWIHFTKPFLCCVSDCYLM